MNTLFKNLFCLLLLSLLGMYSCSSDKPNQIYKDGREWVFDVNAYNSDKEIINSCILKMQVGKANSSSILSGQKGITYLYKNCGDDKIYEETTGVDEEENNVFLHSPRLGMFSFTEVVPFPSITFPLNSITSSEIELKVLKSAYEPAENKTIKQKLERTTTDTLTIANKKLFCYLVQGENTNYIDELGKFTAVYWFHEKYGFVRFQYKKSDNSTVDIILKEVNF